MKRATVALVVVVLLQTVVAEGVLALPPGYRVIDLGDQGRSGATATAISDTGIVVGHSSAGGTYIPFRWTAGTGMVDLFTMEYVSSRVADVNDAGQVVGRFRRVDNPEYAFLWDPTAGLSLPGFLGSARAERAWGINNHSEMVGFLDDIGWHHAYFRDSSGQMQDLGTLGGAFSYAVAVNDSSQVAGFSRTAENTPHAFLWTPDGGMVDLGGLTENETQVGDINNAGHIVGNSRVPGGDNHGWLWTEQTGYTDITPEGLEAYPTAVNDSDTVVGGMVIDLGGGSSAQRAFVWDAEDGMRNINDLLLTDDNWLITELNDINASGQIVGKGRSGDQWHAILLDPVPEPATMVLLGLGLAPLLIRRRRTRTHLIRARAILPTVALLLAATVALVGEARAGTPAVVEVGAIDAPATANQLAYSNVQGRLLLRSGGTSIRVIDTNSGAQIGQQNANEQFTDMDLSPDGRFLFAADFGGENNPGLPDRQHYCHRLDLETGVWQIGRAPSIAYRVAALSRDRCLLLSYNQWLEVSLNQFAEDLVELDRINMGTGHNRMYYDPVTERVYRGYTNGTYGIGVRRVHGDQISSGGGYGTHPQSYGSSALSTDGAYFYYGPLQFENTLVLGPVREFPEAILAATPDVAFGEGGYYDARSGELLGTLGFETEVLALSGDGRELWAFSSSDNSLRHFEIIPEPGTLGLFGLGLSAIFARRSKRNRR